MVVLRISPAWRLCRRMQLVFFIAQNAALLASPSVTLKHSLPRAGRVKRHAIDLASLAKRGGQRCVTCRAANRSGAFLSRSMVSPSVIPVALWAAIFTLVLPWVLRDVLHPETAFALGVLADERRWESRFCTLARAVGTSLSKPARRCLKRLIAVAIAAANQKPPALAHVHAVVGTKMLRFPARSKRFVARFALMAVNCLSAAVPTGSSTKRQAASAAPNWVSAANAIPENYNSAAAACE